MIKNITSGCQLISIIVTEELEKDGMQSLTDEGLPLQVVCASFGSEHRIGRHSHPSVCRVIDSTMECLIVREGKVLVDFYDDNQEYICSQAAGAGDLILFVSGGHGLRFLEPSKILEVRQGPYNKDLDKLRF